MRTKNTIKVKKIQNDNLKGSGKLGYSESNKLHSTAKRVLGIINSKEVHNNFTKKQIVVCPGCNKKFHTNNPNKIPQHKSYNHNIFDTTICSQTRSLMAEPKIKEKIETFSINELELSKGTKVMFIPYPWHEFFNVQRNEVLEEEVDELYLMDNDKVFIKFKNIKKLIPSYIFKANKNFIKI